MIMHNFGKQDVRLPSYTPVAQYYLNPEVAPHADLEVDEIIDTINVEGSTPEEVALRKQKLRDALFADRQHRRSYFSETRLGLGAGVPPAEFEETEASVARKASAG